MGQAKQSMFDESVVIPTGDAHKVMSLLHATRDRDIAEALGLIGYLGHDRLRTGNGKPKPCWRTPAYAEEPTAIPIAPSFGRSHTVKPIRRMT